MEKTYTTTEICRGLDIPQRQLVHWAEKGLVQPLVEADGFASRREYTAENVFEIAIINALWGRVSNKTIKLALEWLAKFKEKPKKAEWLVIAGENVHPISRLQLKELPSGMETFFPFLFPGKAAFAKAIDQSDLTIILNVGRIRRQVEDFLTK